MFEYIKGTLVAKALDYLVVEVSGIAFRIYSSSKTISRSGNIKDDITIYTYLNVREDNISIFGFSSKEELFVFEMLLGVSGIGPRVAINILSSLEARDISMAIVQEDVKALTRCKGVGAKTAQRLIFELKDKVKKSMNIDEGEDLVSPDSRARGQVYEDAISALMVLGYNNREASSAIKKVYKEGISLEDLVREALKNIS